MQGQGKREIPEKIRLPAASLCTISIAKVRERPRRISNSVGLGGRRWRHICHIREDPGSYLGKDILVSVSRGSPTSLQVNAGVFPHSSSLQASYSSVLSLPRSPCDVLGEDKHVRTLRNDMSRVKSHKQVWTSPPSDSLEARPAINNSTNNMPYSQKGSDQHQTADNGEINTAPVHTPLGEAPCNSPCYTVKQARCVYELSVFLDIFWARSFFSPPDHFHSVAVSTLHTHVTAPSGPRLATPPTTSPALDTPHYLQHTSQCYSEYRAAAECKGGKILRKLADQWHRPARFLGVTQPWTEPSLPWWEVSSLTA
ncbi:hypothetical protein PR048_026436 [Dryococelus australis]|uniref:Uncharacterized protein n=1 Tax=Dryococelus australis TaxID=614101 RepID=A0ABQ9GLB0_9NEOP|nr:hypothetical protein PR048_026436 [Dryococelus australis]